MRDVVDQLLDEDRLAEPGAAEEADLAALDEGRDQVDDLEPGLEDLELRREVAERRGVAVDRPPLHVRARRRLLVDRVARDIPEPPERRVADRDGDRPPRVGDDRTTGHAIGRVHRDGTNAVVAEVLLHLRDQGADAAVGLRDVDGERAVDLRKPIREDRVHDDALDLDDLAGVLRGISVVGHASPRAGCECLFLTSSRLRFEAAQGAHGPGRNATASLSKPNVTPPEDPLFGRYPGPGMGSRWTQVLAVLAAVIGAGFAIAIAVILLDDDATASRADYQASVVSARDQVDFALARITRSQSIEELIERIDEAAAVVGKTASDLDDTGVAEGFEPTNEKLVNTLRAFSNELASTAEQFRDPTFGDALGGITSLSFPLWDKTNKVLAELDKQGIQVEQLERH